MAWGTPVTETVSAIANVEKEFTNQITLAPSETAQVQIKGTSSGTTDGLNIAIYSTADDVTWDTVALTSLQLTDDSTGSVVSMVIGGVVKFKIGVTSSGLTDTFTADLVAAVGTP